MSCIAKSLGAAFLRIILFTFSSAGLQNQMAFAQDLPNPTVTGDTICGAGTLVLRASSELNGTTGLMYNWYRFNGSPELIKSIESGTFVTPELIVSETFAVSVSLNGEESNLVGVDAIIQNRAEIQEAPRITLCDSVVLHASTTFSTEDINSATFQWQRYEAKTEEEGSYQNIAGAAGTTGLTYITKKAGFYRIVVTRSDGCKAISAGIEVTNEDIIYAKILGAGNLCFIQEPGEVSTSELGSEYGRDITTYLWEESIDGINFTDYSTDRIATIYNPTPDDQDSSTLYYRLTVTEQTCSISIVDTVYWIRSPEEPVVTRLGSTADFFYCETDAEELRTLKVTSPETDVTYYWLRIQDGYGSYNTLRTDLKNTDPFLMEDFYLPVTSGDSIVLGKDDWGLYMVKAVDTLTSCYNYSNRIFADSAIPVFSSDDLDNVICLNLETPTLSAFDPTADTYSWLFSSTEEGPYTEISTAESVTLDPPSTTGNGWYMLHVTKNGCENTSDTLFIDESEIPFPIIEADKDTICPGETIEIASSIQDALYDYEWTNLSFPGVTVSNDPSFTTSVPGRYQLAFSNEYCTYSPGIFELEELPEPDVKLNTDDLNTICGPFQVELSNPDLTNNTYQWYYSADQISFSEIVGEDSTSYTAQAEGWYYVEALSSNGCSAISETVEVTGVTSAEINITSDSISLCGTSPQTLLAVATPYPDNQYLWMYSTDSITYNAATETNNESSYIASAQGFYKVQTSDGTCTAESRAVFIGIDSVSNPSFQAKISGDGLLCSGTQSTFHSDYTSASAEYTWYYAHDNSTYSVFSGETADSLVLDTSPLDTLISGSTAAFYLQLAVTDSSCFSVSEPLSIVLYRHTTPELTTDGEDGLCGPYTLEVTNVDANSTYQWYYSPDSTNFAPVLQDSSSKYSAAIKGYYYVESSSADGCTAISEPTHIVGVTSPDTQFYTDTATICGASSNVYLRATSYPDNQHLWLYSLDGTSFVSADGTNDQLSYLASEEGYYKVQTTDGACSSESTAIFVQIDPTKNPTIDAAITGEERLCERTVYTFASEHRSESAIYSWFYSFDESSYFTIADEEQDTLRLDTDIFSASMTSDSLQLYLQLVINDSSCLTISEPFPLTIHRYPETRAQDPISGSASLFYCDATDLGALEAVQTTTTVPGTYQWQYRDLTGDFTNIDNANQSEFEPAFPGVYHCITVAENGVCEVASNEVRIRALPTEVYQVNGAFCDGDIIELMADPGLQPYDQIANFTYWWFVSASEAGFTQVTNNNLPFLTISPGSPYYGNNRFFFIASYQGCTIQSDTFDLASGVIPAYEVITSEAYCEGQGDGSVELEFAEDFEGFYSLNDSIDQATPLFDNLSAGPYWITISSAEGCTEQVAFEIENTTELTIEITAGQQQVRGIPFSISAAGASTYQWYPGDYFGDSQAQSTYATIPERFAPDSIFLAVIASTTEGCIGYGQITIRLSDVGNPTFSKFISPDGDGQNDYFEIVGLDESEESYLQILDNWGKEVYSTKNYKNSSDQSEEMNKNLKTGIYFYIFKSDQRILKGSFYTKK